ncbi:MAG: DUF4350 domain-containing protein [Sphingomonadales bacterium]|nr:DUF4350 domain-containing protein [Sphingomonadales bacterium]MDE2569511.1 DUF4350 domain-containing protein [Sphingomonadales bacterium]
MSGEQAGNPAAFGRGAVLGLVLVGALAFVALLYLLSQSTGGNANDGGGHVGGKGLNGFAGLAAMLEAQGRGVDRIRNEGQLYHPGLLVLTPPMGADGAELQRIVLARRYVGATLIVAPKWLAAKSRSDKAKRGWVTLDGAGTPEWRGFYDDILVSIDKPAKGTATGWRTAHAGGPLPAPQRVLSGRGTNLVPLVKAPDGRILAAYVRDKGHYPDLEDFAGVPGTNDSADQRIYPVIFVFEPDLLDNWGLADERTALMAQRLIAASETDPDQPVAFDLTLNGFAHTRSLLDLAFNPPFVAATICLLLAAFAVGWRAFNRFGPPRAAARAIAPGKTALVSNSAGLIRRAGRIHLVSAPYADASRDRLAAALGLRRGRAGADIEAAIDRVQDARGVAGPKFSQAAAALRAARNPLEVARRAATLHSIERALT